MPDNHTNIDDLVELHKNPSPFLGSGSPEGPRHFGEQQPKLEDKEHEDVEIHEIVEHEPEPEVAEYVDVRKETVEVPPDMKKLGVQASTPQHFTTTQKIQLPISDDKIIQGQKAPVTSSIRWLAEFCVYLLKRAHIQLKIAHGKAKRIFKQ